MYKIRILLPVFVLVFFMAGMVLCAFAYMMGFRIEWERKPNIRNPAVAKRVLNKCAKRMEIKFPSSARLLKFAEDEGFLDYAAYFKIEIDGNDLESFIANSPFAGEKLSADERYTYSIGKKWWDRSESAKNFRSGFTRLPRDGYAEPVGVLIDLDKPGKAIIYLKFGGAPIEW